MLVDGGRLYWASRSFYVNPNQLPGGLYSANLDGTDPVTVFSGATSTDGCTGVVAVSGKAYFLCGTGVGTNTSEIRECTLPCGAGSSTVFTPSVNALASALAADPATGKLYYTVATQYGLAPNGGVFDSAGNRVGNVSQANPEDIVIANGSIYWLNSGTYTGGTNFDYNAGVKRASLSSLGTETVVVADTTRADLSQLAVDAFAVYYTDAVRQLIVAGASATGASPTIFDSSAGYSVATDGTNVYFDDNVAQVLRYCPRGSNCGAGGTALANEGAAVITLDANSVVYVSGTAIHRVAKP
jgi:hypothetical protein